MLAVVAGAGINARSRRPLVLYAAVPGIVVVGAAVAFAGSGQSRSLTPWVWPFVVAAAAALSLLLWRMLLGLARDDPAAVWSPADRATRRAVRDALRAGLRRTRPSTPWRQTVRIGR